MIELGKRQVLTVVRQKEFGVYLAEKPDSEQGVLLPSKQVPEGTKVGDQLEAFIYKDSEDRLIATMETPKLQVGETAVLEVKDVAKIGAFLDMGLIKHLLLPFKEQTYKVRPGDRCLVAMYVDKSARLAATMKVYSYLSSQSPYAKDSKVSGTVYQLNEKLGAFIAVDNLYYGLVPSKELFSDCRIGDVVEARVTRVREDGKLDLSLRDKAYLQIDLDAGKILEAAEQAGGVLPFDDKASPELIRKEFNISKNTFKRAVGHLLKNGSVKIENNTIVKL